MTGELETGDAGAASDAPQGDSGTTPTNAGTLGEEQSPNTDAESPDAGTAEEEVSEYAIPEEYKDSKWTEGIKSEEDLWKKLANSQKLIGEKTIKPIDYDTASAEQIAEHHKSLVPEDAGAYKFGEEADPEFSKAIVPALQEAGIHPAQLKTLEPAINKIASDLVGKQHETDRSEDGYFELTEKAFGENHKEVIVQLENSYKEHLSDETKQFLDNASNKERVAFDQTVKSIIDAKDAQIKKILEEHGVEETGAQSEGEPATQKVDIDTEIEEKRAEIDKLNNKTGYKDWTAIDKAKAELKVLYGKKVKLQK